VALVAAIYDRYAQDKITVLENLTRKVIAAKKYISQMESFFHGKVQD
jgi:mevalonate kinase